MSSRCITPFYKKDGTGPFPCGRCPSCRARRASDWSFRLMQEEKNHTTSFFITLTYDTDHVPISKNGFMSLDKIHLQLFFKRLRKINKNFDGKFKYYAVGEYGGRSRRPHYHIIAFSTEIPVIERAWELGSVHYGTVTGASIGYTLKYMTKPKKCPEHRNDDRVPEFSLISKEWGCRISQMLLSIGISRI